MKVHELDCSSLCGEEKSKCIKLVTGNKNEDKLLNPSKMPEYICISILETYV